MGDVINVHRQYVVFAAHIHPVLVLIHVQESVVHGLVRYTVVFKGRRGLQVWETNRKTKLKINMAEENCHENETHTVRRR